MNTTTVNAEHGEAAEEIHLCALGGLCGDRGER